MAKKLYFSILILSLCFSAEVFAYSQHTHEVISTVAFRASILGALSQQKQLANIGLSAQRLKGYAVDGNEYTRDIQVLVSEGAYDEDCCGRFFNHFFNPITQTGLFGFESSLEWGLELNQDIGSQDFSYKDAKKYYLGGLTLQNPNTREHFLSKTFYALGHVIHLLQDLAQPQHTRVESHTPFQPSRSLYEEWTETVLSSLPYNNYPDIYPGNRQIFDAPKKFWLANSDGLAEFSYYNFLTQGHNCNNASFLKPVCDPGQRQNIPDIQNLCNNPNQDPVACSVPALNSSLMGEVTFQITGIFGLLSFHNFINDQASTLSIFDPFLEDCNWSDCSMPPVWNLNRFNFRRAHQFLIPQAIGYSVGLLNYFFRGSIDANLDANGNVIVKNLSSEAMTGTFSLHYDDANDERRSVISKTGLTIGSNSIGSLGSFTPPTSPPPKEPGKYILVFEGSMGQEDNAVAGKIIVLSRRPELRVTKAGSGSGTVTSDPPGIDCRETCPDASATFDSFFTPVRLTATPAPGSDFVGWSGDCAGILPTTDVSFIPTAKGKNCIASFALLTDTVSLDVGINVVGSPFPNAIWGVFVYGLSDFCPLAGVEYVDYMYFACVGYAQYYRGETASLRLSLSSEQLCAVRNPNPYGGPNFSPRYPCSYPPPQFVEWSGDCSGNARSTSVVMNMNKRCVATIQWP